MLKLKHLEHWFEQKFFQVQAGIQERFSDSTVQWPEYQPETRETQIQMVHNKVNLFFESGRAGAWSSVSCPLGQFLNLKAVNREGASSPYSTLTQQKWPEWVVRMLVLPLPTTFMSWKSAALTWRKMLPHSCTYWACSKCFLYHLSVKQKQLSGFQKGIAHPLDISSCQLLDFYAG